MSWQEYVDDHLMCEIEGNHLSAAAIVGNEGSVWAQSVTFPKLKPEEMYAIMNDFAKPGSLAQTGSLRSSAIISSNRVIDSHSPCFMAPDIGASKLSLV
ncbi:hypothetical protein V6N13_114520 [Hibiscus sabdariffa]